ncbi:hypothetical protein TELCIR_08246 [Teladorsagia circumcincta]|uniref:Uncharacterized protein n=1 Tax=Teladorsagia circumcincta TaxID=45464 RepID=A0A2G9UI40_TELCI|nr:hypothetical protein TELCIR_08246 [Teladorsagia circumcincta]
MDKKRKSTGYILPIFKVITKRTPLSDLEKIAKSFTAARDAAGMSDTGDTPSPDTPSVGTPDLSPMLPDLPALGRRRRAPAADMSDTGNIPSLDTPSVGTPDLSPMLPNLPALARRRRAAAADMSDTGNAPSLDTPPAGNGRPVAIYGAECWPVTKEVEARFSVMETKMLRWTAGVTRLDHIRNGTIRKRFGVAPIADKMREARLRWYGHVLRANDDTVCKIGLDFNVPGKRPRGRPKQRWLDTLHEDLKLAGLHPDQAHNREKWRRNTRKADPATGRALCSSIVFPVTMISSRYEAVPFNPAVNVSICCWKIAGAAFTPKGKRLRR